MGTLWQAASSYLDEVSEVELEVARELEQQLMHAVEPLQEDGTALVGVGRGRGARPAPVRHLVPVVQPLALHQHLQQEGGQ